MMTGRNLPDGKKGLSIWAETAGFEPVETGEDEAIFEFDSADELLKWLEMTGALAGLGAVFEDYYKGRLDIVSESERTNCSGGACSINHRFAIPCLVSGTAYTPFRSQFSSAMRELTEV